MKKKRIKRDIAFISILITTLLSMPILVNAGKPPHAGGPKHPIMATFTITFVEPDIESPIFETEANVENWEPETVKGKGKVESWAIETYSVTGIFVYLDDIPWDEDAPDPQFGEPDFQDDSSICDFFDINNLITISWLEHIYSSNNDYWVVGLNQTDGEGHNYLLDVRQGTGEYDETSDKWTVTFNNAYSFIEWWEWLEEEGHGQFHTVWKGYINFNVEIQR